MKRLIAFTLVAFSLVPSPAFSAGSLGIGVTILQKNDDTKGDLSQNSNLWFSMKPGQSQSRDFLISSASNIQQNIEFDLYQIRYIDGVAIIDTSKKAESADWVTFTPSSAKLKPREVLKVKVSFDVPAGTKFGNYDGFLRVTSSGATNALDKNAKVQAVIKNSLAFDQKFWLGVGDGEFLKTDFELDNAKGIIKDGKKYILILVKNIGGTPIAPRGSIQLQDSVFAENKIGPLNAGVSEILPKNEGWFAAEVPPETNDGKWKIFVTASQGNITKTKMFEEDIKFIEEGSGLHLPWQMILIIFFFGLLIFGIRMIRFPAKTKSIKSKKAEVASDEFDLNKLSLEELEAILSARLGDKASKAKKSPTKRAAKKPVKKVVTGKKASKTSSSVKKSAKKSPTKKTVKKVAKKSPVKRSSSKR